MNKKKIEIIELELDNKILAREMEEYHKIYKHRKPCKEWIEDGWCEHYVRARAEKFKDRINNQIKKSLDLSQKRVF